MGYTLPVAYVKIATLCKLRRPLQDTRKLVKISFGFLWQLIHPFSAPNAIFRHHTGYKPAIDVIFARVTSLTVFVTIAFFTLAGETVLRALGISIGSFQIAGGSLVFLIALNMMNGEGNPVKPSGQDNVEWDEWSDFGRQWRGYSSRCCSYGYSNDYRAHGISTVIIYAAPVHRPGATKTGPLLLPVLSIALFSVI